VIFDNFRLSGVDSDTQPSVQWRKQDKEATEGPCNSWCDSSLSRQFERVVAAATSGSDKTPSLV